MGREYGSFHTFRRFRESILQMSDAVLCSLILDGTREPGHVGTLRKQLLDNVQWGECAAKVGLGFALPAREDSR